MTITALSSQQLTPVPTLTGATRTRWFTHSEGISHCVPRNASIALCGEHPRRHRSKLRLPEINIPEEACLSCQALAELAGTARGWGRDFTLTLAVLDLHGYLHRLVASPDHDRACSLTEGGDELVLRADTVTGSMIFDLEMARLPILMPCTKCFPEDHLHVEAPGIYGDDLARWLRAGAQQAVDDPGIGLAAAAWTLQHMTRTRPEPQPEALPIDRDEIAMQIVGFVPSDEDIEDVSFTTSFFLAVAAQRAIHKELLRHGLDVTGIQWPVLFNGLSTALQELEDFDAEAAEVVA